MVKNKQSNLIMCKMCKNAKHRSKSVKSKCKNAKHRSHQQIYYKVRIGGGYSVLVNYQ